MDYITLVNKLRDKFNEVNLVDGSTWQSAVGFDQFTKDAINYAYNEILDAEMEWPFLHQTADLTTTPGDQFYTPTLVPPTGFVTPAELKEIDWESFYIKPNETETAVIDETQTVEASTPYSATATFATKWALDAGAKDNLSVALTPTDGDPGPGEYTVRNGVYFFNSNLAGLTIKVSYTYADNPVQQSPINPIHLEYIDYDAWRQNFLSIDLGGNQEANKMPSCVFKTQNFGEIGLTPICDKIYKIRFEYWLQPLNLSATTDETLIPSRFMHVLLNGAQKHCYEFREDPQLSTLAEKRFNAGITRMRVELINRTNTMRSGMRWKARGPIVMLNVPAPR